MHIRKINLIHHKHTVTAVSSKTNTSYKQRHHLQNLTNTGDVHEIDAKP